MNGAVLKLAILGSKSSWGRFAGVAVGVAIGVSLLLLLWGAANGLTQRDERGAWLREQGQPAVTVPLTADGLHPAGPPQPVPLTDSTILVANPADIFRDEVINRRDIAALPTSTVTIPGIATAPVPGTYYASPALQNLIESTPADQLGQRYGEFAGYIDDSALPGPDALVVITGATEAGLRQGQGPASLVSQFTNNPYGDSGTAYKTALLIGGIAVFFPVLLLISIATGLGAAQRRERYAALRLIGASPRLVSRISALETAVPSLVGALLGVVLAQALTPAAAQVPVNGTRMFVEDLNSSAGVTVAVVLLVVVAAAVVAALRTLRAGVGPLGATRAIQERTPRWWRALPLLAGLSSMAAAAGVSKSGSIWISLLLLGGFVLTSIGIVLIGPWLTRLTSTLGLRFARTAPAVIAGSRIRQTPAATFRSVSGLVIAVFMVSVFAGAGSAIEKPNLPPAQPGVLLPTSVYAAVADGSTAEQVSHLASESNKVAGITSTVITYASAPIGQTMTSEAYIQASDAAALGFEDIPEAPVLALDMAFLQSWTTQPITLKPAPIETLEGLVPLVVVVGTDGTPEALDRARTALNTSGTTAHPANSKVDMAVMSPGRLVQGLSALAYLGVFVAVLIAGISLAVATAAAILDRQRVLGLMRLMGMPVAVLRKVIVREAAVPLLAVLLLSVGLGFLVAWFMIYSLGEDRTITWPSISYYIALIISLVLALGAVAATFGLLRTNTAITTTRFE